MAEPSETVLVERRLVEDAVVGLKLLTQMVMKMADGLKKAAINADFDPQISNVADGMAAQGRATIELVMLLEIALQQGTATNG